VGVRHSLTLLGTILGLSLGLVAPVQAFDWASLWSSAEQRAARQFERQQYDELINNAPDAGWRGLSEFRKGDYAAAAKSFEQQRGQAEEAEIATDVDRAMYNQANAHIMEENYQAAISLFDELLESDPLHANAQHNRDIAQQLLEQQQQQQQQQQSGEQGEQSDENQSESDGEQDQQEQQQDQESGEGEQSESQNSEQGEDQEQNGQSEQQSPSNSQGSDSDSEDTSASDAEEQAEQDAAAAAAMQAERERQANEQQTENAGATEHPEPIAPLTEREQANEQWLRQIPDDPAGLLERKIHNRHQTDFPKVLLKFNSTLIALVLTSQSCSMCVRTVSMPKSIPLRWTMTLTYPNDPVRGKSLLRMASEPAWWSGCLNWPRSGQVLWRYHR